MIDIRVGDCREHLRLMEAASVDCVVTSPPYLGLRDYGMTAQIGLEPSIEAYIKALVDVFREVRRVLRDDGALWLNMGDVYYTPRVNGNVNANSRNQQSNLASAHGSASNRRKGAPGLKPKDLIGLPWRLAFALRDDGWYLRQDIIWSKPNPMPESVRDRCTKSHEYLFLLSKRERYYFNQEAILEPVSLGTRLRLSSDVEGQTGSWRAHAGAKTNGPMKAVSRKVPAGWHQGTRGDADPRYRVRSDRVGGARHEDGITHSPGGRYHGSETRNKRSVWTIPTAAFKEAHFATFPPALVEPCILAGSNPGGTVLDPFAGAGTVGLVAQRLQRGAVLIELNPDYALMAQKRIRDDAPLLTEFAPESQKVVQ